jgi:hypothetical protein
MVCSTVHETEGRRDRFTWNEGDVVILDDGATRKKRRTPRATKKSPKSKKKNAGRRPVGKR